MVEDDVTQRVVAADLIGDLEAASKVPAKRRPVGIKSTVEKLSSLLYEDGALPDDLVRLVELVAAAPTCLDQGSLAALVRNLYPASGKVSDEAVLAVVGCLGHGVLKPALPIQALLLRWLILVYHVLENHVVLSRCYAVLFGLLDTAAIRPQLCHLLALITRRKHVRPFRIQAMLDLSRQTGHNPGLIGLLRVFKNYYPEVIVGDATRGKASPFKYPDPEWRERMEEIQAAHRVRQQDAEMVEAGDQNGFRVAQHFNRGKDSLVPAVQTSDAHENSVILEEIDGAEQFVQNLERIELPNQLVAVLADPLLQKLLLLRPDADADSRIRNCLEACLADAAEDTDLDQGSALLDLLEVVLEHAMRSKTLHPVAERVLHRLYPVWNGDDRRDVVLDTLTFLPFQPWSEVYQTHLLPLERKLLNNTRESRLALLAFYAGLFRRWRVGWFSTEQAMPAHLPATVTALTEHVNRLSLTLYQTAPDSCSTQLAMLEFYDQGAELFSHDEFLLHIEFRAPPPAAIRAMAFSDSLAVLSCLGTVLANYKRGLAAAMKARPHPQKISERDHRELNLFNSFFMDVCNNFWRQRAFDRRGRYGVGFDVPKPVVSRLADWAAARWGDSVAATGGDEQTRALRAAFGLSLNPALSLMAISHVRRLEDEELAAEAEEEQKRIEERATTATATPPPPPLRARHAGPVTEQSLKQLSRSGGLDLSWHEYQLGVLRDLERSHLGGITDFLYEVVSALKGLRDGKPEGASQASG